MQMGQLEVVASPYHIQTVNQAAFDLKMPSLKYLKVSTATDTVPEFHIRTENVPTLQDLESVMMHPQAPTPLASITDFR
jgi:hypothetical protein